MSTKIKAGILLPAGTAVNPEPIFVEDYKSIQQYVGGNFDCVVTNLGKQDVSFLGYVHDEGLILDMEFNYIASALFQRELHGDCVVLWGLSPEGEYDGEDYDIPESMVKWINGQLMEVVAKCYGQSALMGAFCEMAIELGLYSEEEINIKALALQETARVNPELHKEILSFFTDMIHKIVVMSKLDNGDDTIERVGEMLIEDLKNDFKGGE